MFKKSKNKILINGPIGYESDVLHLHSLTPIRRLVTLFVTLTCCCMYTGYESSHHDLAHQSYQTKSTFLFTTVSYVKSGNDRHCEVVQIFKV